MKLRVKPWRLIWRFLVVLAVIYVAFFGLFFNMFFSIDTTSFAITPRPWDYKQPLLIAGIFAICLGTFIPSFTSYYYICESKHFIMKKYGKEYEFDYANIEFIDIEQSKKKQMVIFYSNKAKMRYLLGDKDGVLLDTLIKKCPNTMSVEQFRQTHPEEKY